MNYLAHVFIADNSADSILGNLLGDFVKGSLHNQYNETITKGIRLHRKVDVFSDSHPIPLQSRNRFSRKRRRFAGIIVDICYDHFLSRHWELFSDENRESFISGIYAILNTNHDTLPERLQRIIPRMIEHDWLGSYYHISGIEAALNGISDRFKRPNPLIGSVEEVEEHYRNLELDFLRFFPDLIQFATNAQRNL